MHFNPSEYTIQDMAFKMQEPQLWSSCAYENDSSGQCQSV